ncbi:MAG: hypothetical protein ACKUBY_05600 [Candidatus Moraniibacteriota bacterium]|jgi:hypothetical protein
MAGDIKFEPIKKGASWNIIMRGFPSDLSIHDIFKSAGDNCIIIPDEKNNDNFLFFHENEKWSEEDAKKAIRSVVRMFLMHIPFPVTISVS